MRFELMSEFDHAQCSTCWPENDRRLWHLALQADPFFGGPTRRLVWRPATIRWVAQTYNYWLNYLNEKGWLDVSACPDQRVTPSRLGCYVRDLGGRLRSTTVLNLIRGLNSALALMCPAMDRALLRALVNQLTREAVPACRRARIQETASLVELGWSLMHRAAREEGTVQAAKLFRDGFQIALLAMRPLRMRNFQALKIGRHLIRAGAGWIIQVQATETKNHKPIEVPFPSQLTEPLELYLRTYRPRLLTNEPDNGGLWISCYGRQQHRNTIASTIREWTRLRYGLSITPHLFRNCAATSLAVHEPESVQIAHNILGNCYGTMQAHYNLAKALDAGHHYCDVLIGLRGQSARKMRRS
jgi:integrase/recombinase XerD